MPRGIPKDKPDAKKPGPKPGAKAAAAKPAVKPAAKPVGVQATAPLPLQQPSILPRTETQSSPVKGNAAMTPVSPAVAEAIAKLETSSKADLTRPQPFRYNFNQRDNYFSLVASKKGLRQTASLYLNGEVLASTQDFTVLSEYVVAFLVDGKQHVFQHQVESETYVNLSEYTGVLLSPVDRAEVEKIIANSDKAAKALAEDDLIVMLQQERPAFKRGDRVYHMLDRTTQFLVVQMATPADPYRPRPFSQDARDVDLDMIIVAVGVNYDANTETSVPTLVAEPKKVYSGLYLLAD
jgi:hypothetical protein